MSLWPNWIRRLTTNQKIGGSSPSRDRFLFSQEELGSLVPHSRLPRVSADIAQLGERQTEDLKVPSSILGLGIVNHHHNLLGLVRAPHGHSTCARAMRHMHVGLSWNAARPWRLAMAFSTRAGMPLGPHDTTSSAHQPCAHHAHRYASQAAALRHNGSTMKFSLQPL